MPSTTMRKAYSTRRKPSFYWYDTETTGLRSSYDRIIQFAGQRTDLNLKPLGEPLNTYVQLPPEIVPTAESFQITKIRPQTLIEQGIPEYELFSKLRQELSGANTCIIGYNNISFDDNFIRFGMYRNLLPPYEHEHKRGNNRLDFLSIVRLTGALRPDGLEWPVVDGVPSFALGNLAAANDIAADNAHDALADVHMTLELARKIKAAQPKLWNYAYTLRKQGTAKELLDPETRQAILHVSPKYGNARYSLAPVLPITRHPEMFNRVIVVDLESNIDLLFTTSSDELASLLFERANSDEKIEPEERLNINVVAINQSPMVAVLKTLLPENVKRLNIDLNRIERNMRRVLEATELPRKLRAIFGAREQDMQPKIAEEALYDDFISDNDRIACANFWQELKNGRSWTSAHFEDPRLRELYARLKTKIVPEKLTKTEVQDYHQFVRQQLVRTDRNLIDMQEKTKELLKQEPGTEETAELEEFYDYLQQLATQYDVERTD
ncbi:MAG: exodeoxyribonuclease I [Gammaproteobacteria bacterium]|nr:exodeoxyribonuclease I [Gammaproteobacteria bacterium]MYC25399.1 exodeoxyribonuclease I [Gammaproteobacteria bacterium]